MCPPVCGSGGDTRALVFGPGASAWIKGSGGVLTLSVVCYFRSGRMQPAFDEFKAR